MISESLKEKKGFLPPALNKRNQFNVLHDRDDIDDRQPVQQSLQLSEALAKDLAETLGLSAVMTAKSLTSGEFRLRLLYAHPSVEMTDREKTAIECETIKCAQEAMQDSCKGSGKTQSFFSPVQQNCCGGDQVNAGCKRFDKSPWKVCTVSRSYHEKAALNSLFLVCWSKQALSTCQKYCIEQQVQLLDLKHCLRAEKTRSAQRIVLLEQAVHHVEHQLRSPLSLVELQVDLLAMQSLGAAAGKPIQAIRQRIAEMSLSLKRLAKCGLSAQRQLAPCDLRSIVRASVVKLAPKIRQKNLLVLCDRTPLTLIADSWQMKQVLDNLLHNAIEFTATGSTIDCRWQAFQQEISLEIRDQGPGFSSQDLKSLFQPFYSCREGGTGLGLTIAQKVILDHRGSIWASNLPEGGAQISIVLPRTA